MKLNIRHIFGLILLSLAISCSTERVICPAYQSAFIHDKTTLDRHFSYFTEDSTPRILEASKDKHLLIDPVTYRKKMRSLQTVEMKDIYPQTPDSLLFNDAIEIAAADSLGGASPDSTMVASAGQDSVYMISLKKEDFNVDQELYLYYLKDYLVYPDVKLIQEQQQELNGKNKASGAKKESFFKRLFGGKKKDKAALDADNIDGDDSVDEAEDKPKKKRSLFGKKDKSDKENIDADPAPKEEAPPEEETDGDEDF